MFLELFLMMLVTFKTDFQYSNQHSDPQVKESVGVVEFGDCEQMAHQKTLGDS